MFTPNIKSITHSNCKSYCSNSDISTYQEFPKKGLLKENMNMDLVAIKKILFSEKPTLVYAYVLTSVKNENSAFLQTGNAPNFQGDHVTLCTCMHHLRCFLNPSEWENGVWIVGITGKEFSSRNSYLFYLMRILKAYPSQFDLWSSNEITYKDRLKKSSNKKLLGDLYAPKNKIVINKRDPSEYEEPILGHSHRINKIDRTWTYDIEYYHKIYKKYQSFLLGDSKNSYIWEKPKIKVEYTNEHNEFIYHPRTRRYDTINSFLEILK